MSALELTADNLVEGYRKTPADDHGKIRSQYFKVSATAEAGDAATTINLCDLPPGKIRVIPELSRVKNSDFGSSSATLHIGHRAYDNADGAAVIAEDPDAFAVSLDMDTATTQKFGAATKFDIFSKAGVRVFGTVNVAGIPQGATLEGFVAYIAE